MLNLFKNSSIFIVGIKGTGLSNLALKLAQFNIKVSGSDVAEYFSTQKVLEQNNIKIIESFDKSLLPPETNFLIYSAAYDKESHPQIVFAAQKNIPIYSYPQFLALLSENITTFGVAGTHGKTTSVAALDFIFNEKKANYLALYGSQLLTETNKQQKELPKFILLEACEYRSHFLNYNLDSLYITTIEHDHPDYFKDEIEVYAIFYQLVKKLKPNSTVVCFGDNPNTQKLIQSIKDELKNLNLITFGEQETNDYKVVDYKVEDGQSSFMLEPLKQRYSFNFTSLPLVFDLIGAAIFAAVKNNASFKDELSTNLKRLKNFKGCSKRVEFLFEKDKITYIDDYAHHPSEIKTSLEHLRNKYKNRRIVTIFYPHTYLRTKTFFSNFVEALSQSDLVVIRGIYSSAREQDEIELNDQLAKKLAIALKCLFIKDKTQLLDYLAKSLHPFDVCVTMGAGNNSDLAHEIAKHKGALND
jgi:UDP-N-acetylmuramate--alanine ligase